MARSGAAARGRGASVVKRAPLLAACAAMALLSAAPQAQARQFGWLGGGPEAVAAEQLKAATSDPRVERFYEQRRWKAAWNERNERALMNALEDAPRHGLSGAAFMRRVEEAGDDPARREVELTLAALTYAQALASGYINPERVEAIFTLARNEVDVVAGLNRNLRFNRLARWLNSLAPQDAEYRALSEAYLQFRRNAGGAAHEPVPKGPLLRPGARDKRVPQIADILKDRGLLLSDPKANRYDEAMVAAIKQLQSDAGIAPDGLVGEATLTALNMGQADRARQLAVNLERRRWLKRQQPEERIDVNTAATFLTYFHDGRRVWVSKVVAGQTEFATPSLGETFNRVVVNPPWNVPESIAKRSILPNGPGYLKAKNMYIEDGRVIQRPGPDAALGLVKFDMVNRYAIYLHDTPAKQLFESPVRHRSNGCVRVENAVEFARLLADYGGAREEFEVALASGETQPVSLGRDIPVRMLYHTAYLNDAGELAFAPDNYGRDEKLAQALGLGAGKGEKEHVALEIELSP